MNAQQQVLRVLQLGHGINKLYAAQYLHVFGLGEVISRLKRKGYDIRTTTVCGNTEQSHVKYVLKEFGLKDIIPDLIKAAQFVKHELTGIINVLDVEVFTDA